MSDAAPLLEVRDLSIAFAQSGEAHAWSIASRSRLRRAARWRWSANPVRARRSRRRRSCACCPIRRRAIRAARSCSSGRDVLKMSDDELRAMRGDGVTMVFQEPMTSLNPLHTIERQIGEIIALASTAAPPSTRDAHHRAADRSRHRRSGAATRRLSAPALRRPAPARDDRHGARQPSRSAHRRRADDRARRHRAGADPRAAEGPAGQARHGDAVHHP